MVTKRRAESADYKKSAGARHQFFDTANIYSTGASEEIMGRALKDYANRDEIVLATKVFFRMKEGPNGAGLSRKAIMNEIDQSLKRLGTDYVDLYQIHRWDYDTPIEETMEALHDVVKAGKARHIGASAMYAWQFQKALHVAEQHGWTRFAAMQNHYNLIYREDEREMLPLCKEEKIGVIPYSPLASGKLARLVRDNLPFGDRPSPEKQIWSDGPARPIGRGETYANRRGAWTSTRSSCLGVDAAEGACNSADYRGHEDRPS